MRDSPRVVSAAGVFTAMSDEEDSDATDEDIRADAVGGEMGGETSAGPAAVMISLIGLPNSGRSSLINAVTASRVASVSRSPGHTKRIQRVQLTPGVVLRDTPPLAIAPPSAATLADDTSRKMFGTGIGFKVGGDGPAPAHVYELCGLTPTSQVREPFS